MKTHTSLIKSVALSLLAVSTLLGLVLFALSGEKSALKEATPGEMAAAPIAARTTAQVREAYGQLPLSFEANRGQAADSIDFVARGPGYAVALSPTEAIFVLRKTENAGRNNDDSRVRKISNSLSERNPPSALAPSTVLRMNLVGANRAAAVAGQNELEGRVNYLIGSDPAKWRTDVPTFGRVRYAEVYPGIDVIYYGNQRRLEYDFVVAPGRDARAIALEFTGAQKVEVDGATGDLLVQVGGETIRQHAPVTYQEVAGAGRRKVESRYAIKEGGQVGFEVGEYDASAPLVIDPVLEYSTFLGGSLGDQGRDIAIDSAGNAYVIGVPSSDFPIANAFQETSNGIQDVFVTKLNAAGSALVYSTYLGGSGYDFGLGIAVDSTGSAYVTGQTSSTDFPTANAFQGKNASGLGNDVFVAKLSPAGSTLVYSTYLGGSSDDSGVDIAVDSAGNAYVTGFTSSTDFPTANGLQNIAGGFDNGDAFVTKFNAAGSALVYSTHLGGGDSDHGESIDVDSAGNAYVTGSTLSTDFPTVNAFQSTFGGGTSGESGDAFVTKFNAAGSAMVYSTYLGGESGEIGLGIAVDSAGSAYVTGGTSSDDFPTANALQSTRGGSGDVFVTKFNGTGSALVYSTYLGGNSVETGYGIAVDSAGNAYLTGFTQSTNFPTANPFQGTVGSDLDAFVTKLNAAGTALVYSSYLGGDDSDWAFGIAVDSTGNAYLTGSTDSPCFPTTTGAFDTTLSLDGDAFITKLSETAKPSTLTPCASELINIATRIRVLTGDSALIGGFIIAGEPKRVIIRGIGPSLAGLQGALANPILELFHSDGRLLISNDDWITNREEVEETTIPPTHDLESAIVVVLSPGAYTAVLRGQNNGTGIGVVEVYDLNVGANSTLANIGSRGFVDTGDNAMIGGFIVGGGSTLTRVLIRGIGPSLPSSIPNALANPTLELRNADGALIRDNDNWRDSQEEEIENTTIPPSHNLEAAIIAAVPNGNYTAILRGENNSTGVAVVEIYNLQ
jgi:hypothetical protein